MADISAGHNKVHEFQAALTHYLLQESATAHATFPQWLSTQDPDGSTAAGLLVYRNNVLLSLTEALAARYPAVQALVGADFFAALARDFIFAFPPNDPVLTSYGEQLYSFIQQHPACSTLPWLGAVTRLEWLCQSALNAADDPLLQQNQLLQLEPEQLGELCLHLHSSAHLLTSPWPVQQIRAEALKAEPQALTLNTDKPTNLLVYRRTWDVQIVTLQRTAYVLLEALQQGHTLAASWQQVQDQTHTADAELLPLLVYLLQLGVFSSHSFGKQENNGA